MTASEKFEQWWGGADHSLAYMRAKMESAYLAGYREGKRAAQQLAEADRAEVAQRVRREMNEHRCRCPMCEPGAGPAA